MARPKVPETLKAEVRARAMSVCEYCHTDETWQYVPFTLDHVVPLSLGGATTLENLALACFHCNRRKGNWVRAVDPNSRQEVPFFNPRADTWREHFAWSGNGLEIIPLTATGRATLNALELNRERVKRIREADVAVGRHPPASDLLSPR